MGSPSEFNRRQWLADNPHHYIPSGDEDSLEENDIRNQALEDAANVVETVEVIHGDQYGTWLGVSEDASALAAKIRNMKK
jgi:hypothetical protein